MKSHNKIKTNLHKRSTVSFYNICMNNLCPVLIYLPLMYPIINRECEATYPMAHFCLSQQSKKISNDQELIQSDPISCPQNQKGNN